MSNNNKQNQQRQQGQQDPQATNNQAKDNQQPATEATTEATKAAMAATATNSPENQASETKAEATTQAMTNERPVKMPEVAEIQQPVANELTPRRGVPTPKSDLRAGVVPTGIEAILASTEDVSVHHLAERLENFNQKLGHTSGLQPHHCGDQMFGLYNTLVNALNASGTDKSFRSRFAVILEIFKKNEKNGLGPHRLYRGVAFWPKGQPEYIHYQALTNMIWVLNNVPANEARSQINLIKCFEGLNDMGRSRLASYFS